MQRILNFWPYLLYLTVGIITLVAFDGTSDSGDSVQHYLLSRSAPAHPYLFLDHWAKPVFMLLSWPWAQLGFVGIKLFNLMVTIMAARLTQLVAIRLQLAHHWLIPILFLFAPLNFIVTFSGLTEPLFSLFVAAGLLLAVRSKYEWAAVVVSFLPFVRSEGLLIIGVFGLFFLLTQRWKALLATSVGHIVLSLVGVLMGKNILWTITEIPYSSLDSPYGSGSFVSFPQGMVLVLGIPILVLLIIGFGVLVHRYYSQKSDRPWIYLIVGSFLAVFLFHTLAWTFGMFNAMGLKRVMIAVMPSMALMALIGYGQLTSARLWKHATLRLVVRIMVIASILSFPFTENHAAIDIDRDLMLRYEQTILQQAEQFLLENATVDQRYVYSCSYLSVVLNIDHYDAEQHIDLNEEGLLWVRPGDLVIWDNWTGGFKPLVPFEALKNDPRYTELGAFVSSDPQEIFEIVVFRYE